MKNKGLLRRVLAIALTVAMLAGFAIPAGATGADNVLVPEVQKVDNSAVSAKLPLSTVEEADDAPLYSDNEVVRVSIVLEDESTVAAGYSTESIAQNNSAVAYRANLQKKQDDVTASIERNALGGKKLDVKWNLTLVANIISADVEFGKISDIEKVDGVKEVVVETRYEPQVVSVDNSAYDPNMAVSSQMNGSNVAWLAGYTGAGSKIAIIDTGLDIEHQSFDADAFDYAIAEDAKKAGKSVSELGLTDKADIAAVLSQLNASERYDGLTADDLYLNSKVAYRFNYIDKNLNVTHMSDAQGEHGSHVSGIATANRYLKQADGSFVDAGKTVGVVGNAPDAQIFVMKVFGAAGGAYDSDYMAAIEDAIVLGADSVNLSLGSANPGEPTSDTYQDILDSLTETDTVVVMSAGNSSYWSENSKNPTGYPYLDSLNFDTAGSPGSFTNSLAVASVDNDGGVGAYFAVGDLDVVYNQSSGYKNAPMATMDTSADQSGTEYDYILIDGVGETTDYAGMDLTGKVVFCARGSINFSKKGDNAAALGAAATVIYNNVAGTINMDLSDYNYTAPCVSITLAQAEAIKAMSETNTTDAGVTYYTGKLTVYSGLAASWNQSSYLTMSSFSSWGVPGDLSMKPEITAPGGSIYSVWGANKSSDSPQSGHDQYEKMSGTSMAAPQVTGMIALVKQYIRDNNLSQDGMTDRALAQSLLMSTATPLYDADGNYYPVIQQGAGAGNVAAATSATSYVTVDGQDDGKAKVELGDDPDRTGSYSFSFTIHSMSDAAQSYNVYADMFTQDAFMYYANGKNDPTETALYADLATAAMDADISFSVNGVEVDAIAAGALSAYDYDNDGDTDKDDAQLLLDHIVNGAEVAANTNTDVNGDGVTNTFDVHYLLALLQGGLVTVDAGKTVTVDVTVELTAEQKEFLDEYYTGGAYVEGFVYATPVADAEGVLPTGHSIPVLGVYGSWTDSSMYEVGLYQTLSDFGTGEEVRTPYLGGSSNTMQVAYADDPATSYVFGGNPVVTDEVYMPERNALNSNDKLTKINFTLLRNAADSRIVIENVTTGEVLATATPGAVSGAFYYSNGQTWRQTGYALNLSSFNPKLMNEGDQGLVTMSMAPAYYVDAEGNTDWDALHDGAKLAIPFVIDNTAPEMGDVMINLSKNTLTVTASDNQYVAGVALFNKAGTTVYTYTGSKQDIQPGEEAVYELDLSNVNGKKFLLQVFDYAMNVATYEINMQIGEEQPLPEMIAFDLDDNYWTTFTKDTDYEGIVEYSATKNTFFAATIVDHYVLAGTSEGDLYVMPEDDLTDETLIGNMGAVVTDMAYNKADGKVYGVSAGSLVTIDKLTGELTEIGEIGVLTNTLACDENGTFYCNNYGTGEVYSFTLDTIDEPELLVKTNLSTTQYVQSMEINPNTGMLCWNSYYASSFWGMTFGYSYFYEIDTTTGEYTRYEDLWDELAALIITEKTSGGGWTDPVDEVSGIQISAESMTLLKGESATLTATVQPWTATDRSVTWTSEDENVAVVDEDGTVTGVDVGETVITATSNLDDSFSASCTVKVEALAVTLEGMLQDEDGNSVYFTWDMENDNTWTEGNEIDTSMISATKNPVTGNYYVMDASDEVWSMHEVNADGETVVNGGNAAQVPLWDMEYSQYFSTEDQALIGSIYYYYFLSPKDPMALDQYAFGLSSRVNFLAGITSLGYEAVEYQGETHDAERFVLLTDAGSIMNFWTYETEEGYSAILSTYPSNLPFEFDSSADILYSSLIADENGVLYLAAYDSVNETCNIYRFVFDEENEQYDVKLIGTAGDKVWPMVLTGVTNNGDDTTSDRVTPNADSEVIEAVKVSAKELANASVSFENESTIDSKANVDNSRKDSNSAETNVRAAGSLNAVTAYEPETAASNVVVDEDAKTVTVKVTAADTTNGLFELSYDPAVLTLNSVNKTAIMSSIKTEDGKVTVGFADADTFTAAVANVVFDYTPVTGKVETTLTLTVKEDGVSTAETTEEISVVLPGLCDHSKTEVRNAKAPTCTEDGYTGDIFCTICGEQVGAGLIIPATGHDPIVVDEKAPTQSHPGYTGDVVCKTCGELLERGETIPAKGGSTTPSIPSHEDEKPVEKPEDKPEESKPVSELPFVDVDVDDWFYENVLYVYKNGIMNGTSDTTFAPDAALTRGMVVTVLYRLENEPEITFSGAFNDVAESDWYGKAVEWAAANGVVNGYGDGKFGPNDAVTVEQLAAILYRYAQFKGYDVTAQNDLSAFADAADVSEYAVEAMKWAVASDLIASTNGLLNAKTNATRAQVAFALHHFIVNVVK